MRIEHTPQVSAEVEVVIWRAIELAALLPHQEHRRARPPLPAKHGVGPDLLHVDPAGITGVGREAGAIILGARISELAPVRILATRDEWLPPELEGQRWRSGVVDSRSDAQRLLVEPRERVVSGIQTCHTEVRAPLRVVKIVGVVAAE